MSPNRMKRKSVAGIGYAIIHLPRWIWIMVAVAFALGFLIRGGGGPPVGETDEIHVHGEAGVEWWTCAMHPQIKLREQGQCPICFMDLIPMGTGDSGDVPTELKMSPAAMKLADIATSRIRRNPAERTIRLSGKVTTDETREGKIAAWVAGRLERLYVNVTGTSVKEGDPLVELYSPALYAAQEELLQARQQVDQARSEAARDAASVTLEAAQEKLRLLGLADHQIEEIEARGTAEDRVIIQSPMTGVVVHKNAVEGVYVGEGSLIYTIADLSSVWVQLDAYERDLFWLERGQGVTFSAEALPGERFEGKVAFIDPVLNEETRTVAVRLNVKNRKSLLKPGMFVRAELQSRIRSGTDVRPPLLVPVSAVLRTGKRAVVYVRKPGDGTPVFEGREIEIGARAADYLVVVSGLEEGEEVVVKGNFKIDSAFQITAKPSMMNPEGGVTMTGHENHMHEAQRAGKASPMIERDAVETLPINPDFLRALQAVYTDYFKGQEALADDDFKKAQEALSQLDRTVTQLVTRGLSRRALEKWNGIRSSIHSHAQHAHHWPDIGAVRQAFEPISLAILDLVKSFGHAGDHAFFEVFCPMAFDNKGASWLQNHDTVDNPYFGSMMLRCGEVRITYGPNR